MKEIRNFPFKIIEAMLFVLAGITFFFVVQFLVADGQDFSHQWRTLPISLSYLMPIYWLVLLHKVIHPTNSHRHKMLLVNGIILVAIGALDVFITSLYLGLGIFQFFDRVFSPIFPLEVYLFSLSSLALGIYILYSLKAKKIHLEVAEGKKKGGLFKRILWAIGRGLSLLISLYFTGGLIEGLSFMNHHNANFPLTIPFYILMILLPLVSLGREFFVLDGEWLSLSKKRRLAISLSLLSLAAIATALMILFYLVDPYYLSDNMHPYLPVDFMGSLELGQILVSVPTLTYSLYLLISTIRNA